MKNVPISWLENIRGGNIYVWGLQRGKWVIHSDIWDSLVYHVYKMARGDGNKFEWCGLHLEIVKISDAYEGNTLCVPRTQKGELLALHE